MESVRLNLDTSVQEISVMRHKNRSRESFNIFCCLFKPKSRQSKFGRKITNISTQVLIKHLKIKSFKQSEISLNNHRKVRFYDQVMVLNWSKLIEIARHISVWVMIVELINCSRHKRNLEWLRRLPRGRLRVKLINQSFNEQTFQQTIIKNHHLPFSFKFWFANLTSQTNQLHNSINIITTRFLSVKWTNLNSNISSAFQNNFDIFLISPSHKWYQKKSKRKETQNINFSAIWYWFAFNECILWCYF